MVFGVRNQIDIKVTPFESSWKTDLAGTSLELCEARKKLEKIKEKKNLHFSQLAMAVPVLGLVKKVSLNGCFWISFLRWERWSSSIFSMMVHDCDNAEENIGKTTYFNQDFPWHYLNSGPMQKKSNSTIVLRVKNWSRNSLLNSLSWWDPKPVQPWPTGKNEDLPSVLFFLIFSWPHTIQGKLP